MGIERRVFLNSFQHPSQEELLEKVLAKKDNKLHLQGTKKAQFIFEFEPKVTGCFYLQLYKFFHVTMLRRREKGLNQGVHKEALILSLLYSAFSTGKVFFFERSPIP